MTKKIAFFDIDGTLLNHDKELPVETIQAIKDLQNSGVYCAIATGRAPFMYEHIRETLGIDSYVSFNGQYVVFEGETIYKNPLPHSHLEELYHDAKSQGHPMVFMNHEGMRASQPNKPEIETSLGSLHFQYPPVDEEFYKKNELYQSLVFCEGNEIDHYRDCHQQFDYIRWHQYSCDVLPSGGSKAQGINQMIQAAGVKLEDTYAFGDGLNDIEMIRDVGTGVAMGNAVDATKQVSDYVTTDVAEGGLVKAIYKLKLL
ncbi:phosphatase [Halobacillus andaensis]|uniref:Phosphatase n=1 Tax=Halobacillus andaensis TaxID=1176239 RepID=A0A917EVQ3_HALAA|nr:Cof-type HAD-IIB family hydrolase [Halobacillus andaensis]MBP2003648.1 Cof subfamily protein (haloacid dehalogenase superfamily) [Halobacillus andaensis]GGF12204.1 phosphatase [Halobacillus andaensis]